MKKVFYLYKSGELQRKDFSLLLQEKNGNVVYIPVEQINLVVCFGDVNLNKRVLGLLNSYSVSILFFNYYGDYIGRFTPKKYSDGKIIINQVNSYHNHKRLYIAKKMIFTEVKNILSLLKYYNKKYHLLEQMIINVDNELNKLDTIESIEELLLLEAIIKKQYYSSFDYIIKNPNFIFKNRSFYPPLNEVISYIHSLSKQSDSLQFDIADMLKPIFIDRLILRMINKNQIKTNYFEYKENGACYLNKEGIKVFLYEYEKLMQKLIKIGGKYYSYRNIITREVYKLSNYIEGKTDEYKPYIMEW